MPKYKPMWKRMGSEVRKVSVERESLLKVYVGGRWYRKTSGEVQFYDNEREAVKDAVMAWILDTEKNQRGAHFSLDITG